MRRLLRPRLVAGLVAGLIALYALAGFVLTPYLINAYGVPAVSDRLKHPVILREAAFNPFTLSLRLNGLEVREANQAPILGFEELFIDLRATTLFWQTLGFDEIRLVMPFVSAKVNREGKLNVLALVPPPDASSPPAGSASGGPEKMIPVEIDLLEINQGIVEYRDESKPKPVSMDIVPIQITLRNFSTIQGSDNAYAFLAEIGKGEKLVWEGRVSLEPLESDGKVSLSGVKIRTLYQAVQDQFRFDVPQGEIRLSAVYHADLRGQAPRVTVKNGLLAVRDMAVRERGEDESVVEIGSVDVEGVQFELEKHLLQIGAIRSADARVKAWMNPGGVLNIQQLVTPVGRGEADQAQSSNTGGQPGQPVQSWSVSVEAFELQNYGVVFEDRTLGRPVTVDVENMDVKVKDIRFPFTQSLPVELSMKLNQTGLVAVRGQAALEPMGADLEITLKHIGIRPFQGYLDRFVNMDVRDGAIDLAGTVRYAEAHPKGPRLRFQGNVGINRFSITDRKEFEEVASWQSLAVNRLALDVEPTSVKIAEVVWQEPAVQAVVQSDGMLNLSDLLVSPAPGDASADRKEEAREKSAAKAVPPTVTIDQVKLVKASATFRDLSIDPAVKTGVTDLSGTIKGLSSKQIQKADIDLAGRIDKAAPLKISGRINPLTEDAFTDVLITLGGMDVTPAGPYSGKYAGYALSKGKLSLDLRYKLSQKLLEAENLVSVDQLTFGQKVDSPDATSLPVPLLVALLQDRNGLIEIDLPIRGNLADPDFKYGKVVIATLVNLLGKIAASPFTLLGKLVPDGGNSEDLQFVEFQPGSASLPAGEIKKLDVLEQALDQRAGLRLDIKGTADAVLDRPALQARKLQGRLMALKRQERGKAEEQGELSAEDEQRLVAELFAKLQAKQSDQAGRAQESAEPTPPTAEEMKQRVAAEIPVADDELESLAWQRGEAVRDRLLQSGKLANERIFLLDVSPAESGHANVRTQLALAAGS